MSTAFPVSVYLFIYLFIYIFKCVYGILVSWRPMAVNGVIAQCANVTGSLQINTIMSTRKCNWLNEVAQYKTACVELTFTRPML